jgi:hypothetical protein
MITKDCSRCGHSLPNTSLFFKKRMKSSDLLTSVCKKCDTIVANEYKHRVMTSRKEYRSQTCSKCLINKSYTEYSKDNKKLSGLSGSCKLCVQAYKDLHKDKIAEYKESYKPHRNKERRARRLKDPQYRIMEVCRSRIWRTLKGITKSARTVDLIGCSIELLIQHIEGQFDDWMSWENYGKWHVDHIIPCASFDLTDEDQQRLCFHFTNLQPLEASENIKKGCKKGNG